MKKVNYFVTLLAIITIAMNCSSVKQVVQNTTAPPKDTIKPVVQELDNQYLSLPKTNLLTPNNDQIKWADSVYTTMTFEEKVGQLFMVAAYSNKDETHCTSIDKLIQDNKIGGLIFFQGGPNRQAKLTNRFQSKSKIPLFIGIDAEWGLSMRLDSTYRYPYNMTLGAIKDLKLIEKVGEQMGQQSKRLGIHFNFSPVVDINTNPNNPIIGNRSFGEDKNNVTNKAIALMLGLQKQNVFATAKHFPGHGDTDTDSHQALPTVSFSKARLDEVELYPYKKLIEAGLPSIMVAHLNVPSLDDRAGRPSSLSNKVVTDLLQTELGFKGLIFTDALNMKGASNFKKPGEIDLEAFLAGNDVLLFPENVPAAVIAFKEAYKNKTVTEERLAKSVKKILQYKYKAGLHQYKPINLFHLSKDLNQPSNDSLQYALYENAITLLKNDKNIISIKDLKQKIAYIKMGDDENDTFIKTLKNYTEVTVVKADNATEYNKKLNKFDLVIIGFHKTDKPWKNQDFTANELVLLQEIAKSNKVILDVFAKPYSLLPIKVFKDIDAVLLSYQNNTISQEVSAQIIFGSVQAKGIIPVTINNFFFANKGYTSNKLNRLGFSNPEYVGMSSENLSKIEQIAQKAIAKKTTPGMQILVARKGKVIYQKTFGNHTYQDNVAVQNTDIYDVASITKMVSTLPNIMQQYEKKKLTLDTYLEDMLPIFKNTNKDSITFKDLLTHNARLQAWIPFYKATLDSCNGFKPDTLYYKKTVQKGYTTHVSDNLYLRNSYSDSIFIQIVNSKMLEKKQYKYSDFTFIILKEYLEKVTGKTLDALSKETFFDTMGMNHTTYNPLQNFDKNTIIPTENDTYFRYSTLQGYVHDMEAAMEGGVAGHAGIFSNTIDIAKMMQMYLQKGEYGGIKYFNPATFDIFNTCYYCAEGNRRGLGFDKPQLGKEGPTCGCVSMASFGHTGFTGGIAWADPESEIIYVFLSNRTYPDSNATNKLSRENVREDIQKIIQESILDKKAL